MDHSFLYFAVYHYFLTVSVSLSHSLPPLPFFSPRDREKGNTAAEIKPQTAERADTHKRIGPFLALSHAAWRTSGGFSSEDSR